MESDADGKRDTQQPLSFLTGIQTIKRLLPSRSFSHFPLFYIYRSSRSKMEGKEKGRQVETGRHESLDRGMSPLMGSRIQLYSRQKIQRIPPETSKGR